MVDKSLLMRLAQHIASITSWCQKSLDTIYVSRCSPTSALSESDRSHSGGHWQDRSLLRTLLLHSWLQMERPHFTWLILASCSDASASVVLWCQRRASGLDKNPPRLNSSIICEPESCEAVCPPPPPDGQPAVPSTHIPSEQCSRDSKNTQECTLHVFV